MYSLNYVHTDYQGSWLAISNASGHVADQDRFSYDAWGRPRDPQTWAVKTIGVVVPFSDLSAMQPRFDRGYTGHETLCGLGLINMNWRLYDPYLQRFLSPDNVIQGSSNSLIYNRYSYCLNNPLKYTDPSGYTANTWSEDGGSGGDGVGSGDGGTPSLVPQPQFISHFAANLAYQSYGIGNGQPTGKSGDYFYSGSSYVYIDPNWGLIAIPSVINYTTGLGGDHRSFYPEKIANTFSVWYSSPFARPSMFPSY